MTISVDDLTNPQLVVIALAQLGGERKFIDREDIGIRVNEIAPGRFVWRKYPDRIDLVVVVDALGDARKPRYGGLVVGGGQKGWMLSPAGVDWVKTLDLSILEDASEGANKFRKGSVGANLELERSRLRNTSAYELFVLECQDQLTVQDLYDFARVNEYFQRNARQRRYNIINNAVVGDEILEKIWDQLRRKFPEEFE